jgi:hypothetical protein
MALGGHEEGRENDPMCIIPAQPVDAPTVPGPFSGDRRENVQILSFMNALSCMGLITDPLSINLPELGDPPDSKHSALMISA